MHIHLFITQPVIFMFELICFKFTMFVWGRRAFIRSSGLVCPVTGRLC